MAKILSISENVADTCKRASVERSYPPISDYGFIADCHASALVPKCGSIDWCCLPRIDSASSFGRLIDWQNGGYCQIHPVGDYRVSRRYVPDTSYPPANRWK